MRGICRAVVSGVRSPRQIQPEGGLQRVHWGPVEFVQTETVFPPVSINVDFPALEHISSLFRSNTESDHYTT